MAPTPPLPAALTIDEAAARLGISKGTMRRLIDRGECRVVRLGPLTVRIPVAELDRLLDVSDRPA